MTSLTLPDNRAPDRDRGAAVAAGRSRGKRCARSGSGEVDAITVSTPAGEQVYSLKNAEQPYREMIEAMSEGAVNISADGTVMYCNQCFAHLVKADLPTIMGSSLLAYFPERDRARITMALAEARAGTSRVRVHLLAVDGGLVPVNVAMHVLAEGGIRSIIIVTSDLTQMVVAQDATNRINLSLEQANRSLRMLNLCERDHSLHATDEEQMLTATCRALVDYTAVTTSPGSKLRGTRRGQVGSPGRLGQRHAGLRRIRQGFVGRRRARPWTDRNSDPYRPYDHRARHRYRPGVRAMA